MLSVSDIKKGQFYIYESKAYQPWTAILVWIGDSYESAISWCKANDRKGYYHSIQQSSKY